MIAKSDKSFIPGASIPPISKEQIGLMPPPNFDLPRAKVLGCKPKAPSMSVGGAKIAAPTEPTGLGSGKGLAPLQKIFEFLHTNVYYRLVVHISHRKIRNKLNREIICFSLPKQS